MFRKQYIRKENELYDANFRNEETAIVKAMNYVSEDDIARLEGILERQRDAVQEGNVMR